MLPYSSQAHQANKDASEALRITRAVEQIDHRPTIQLRTRIAHGARQGELTIHNTGPLEAVQVVVRLIIYKKRASHPIGLVGGTSWTFSRERLSFSDAATFIVTEDFLANAGLGDPPHVFGVRITYHHPRTLISYVDEAFYFTNPAGNWVTENDTSIKDDSYKQLRSALLELAKRSVGEMERGFGDPLHSLR